MSEPLVAITTTVREPGPSFDSFVRYHLAAGVGRIYVFFDDPDDPAANAPACADERVEALRCDVALRSHWVNWPEMREAVDTEVMARQVLNTELALRLAESEGVQWLLHIDADEAFFPGPRSVPEAFAALNDVDWVTFLNVEAVPEHVEVRDFFREITLFKANPATLSDEQRAQAAAVPQFPDRVFFYYSNGKSAVRVQDGVLPSGVHGFTSTAGPLRHRIVTEPAILHYMNAGFENFWRRYRTWGPFADRWFASLDIASSIGRFHLDARDVVATGDRDGARAFYDQRVVLRDAELRDALIEAGICTRIPAVADRLD